MSEEILLTNQSHFKILKCLMEGKYDENYKTKLSKRAGVVSCTGTKTIKNLVRLGLACEKADSKKKYVSITAKGRKIYLGLIKIQELLEAK